MDQWIYIHCQQCEEQAEELLEDFSKQDYEAKGWRFGIFDEPENSEPIRETMRTWFISGLCPKCNAGVDPDNAPKRKRKTRKQSFKGIESLCDIMNQLPSQSRLGFKWVPAKGGRHDKN